MSTSNDEVVKSQEEEELLALINEQYQDMVYGMRIMPDHVSLSAPVGSYGMTLGDLLDQDGHFVPRGAKHRELPSTD